MFDEFEYDRISFLMIDYSIENFVKINKIFALWLWVSLGLLAGCSKPSTVASATHMADAFFQAIKIQDFETASGFFIESAAQPRQEWLSQLRDHHDKLGDLQSYTLQNQIINTVYSGVRYTLSYRAKYSKHEAQIKLIVFEGVSSDATPQIEAMQIRSTGL